MQIFKKKKDENIYFREKISQRQEKLLTPEEKKQTDF